MNNNQRIGFTCPVNTANPIDIYINRTVEGSNSVTIKYWDMEDNGDPKELVLSITNGDDEGTEYTNQTPVCSGIDLEINPEYDPAFYEMYRKTEGTTEIDLYYYSATDGGRRKKLRIPVGRKKPSI